MKKKILILGGGISREREISLNTANQVKNCLKKKYKVLQADLNSNFETKLKSFNYKNGWKRSKCKIYNLVGDTNGKSSINLV